MTSYEKTIVQNNPEYVGKKLFLITESKEKLFYTDDGFYIEIEIENNEKGKLLARKISIDLKKIVSLKDYSLRKIGIKFLGFKDPSVPKMLKYFILPEMEVERIFNNLRFKYLNSIYLSGFKNPEMLISAQCNKAFQALAGLHVRQGRAKEKKANDYFWKNAGFTSEAKKINKFKEEYEELRFILTYIRKFKLNNFNKIYAELIAIKPGFHEIWIHPDYFEDKYNKKKPDRTKDKPRDKIFRLLRGQYNLDDLKLKKMPGDVKNFYNYIRYAPCNITEGPFVFRKNISVSYYEEIKKIKSKEKLLNLQKYFWILDYKNGKLNSRQELKEFLSDKAEKFRYYI